MKTYYSNGKLLLTGEYVVLDGALSLALPTKQGQSLRVEHIDEPKIIWQSFNEKDAIWFKDEFLIKQISSSLPYSNDISIRLVQILKAAKKLNSAFCNESHGWKISTKLDFPRHWGLGTSSTLINNIAQWTNVDAYTLLEHTFGGSGYDIACAQHPKPITYQIQKGNPLVNEVDFNPTFKNQLYFVHLNKKQDSREGIKHYHQTKEHSKLAISEINEITKSMLVCNALENFVSLINTHESIISKITKQTPVKDLLFPNFNGSIKSLGAWGGDFALAASKTNPSKYFKNLGFSTVIPYSEMV